MGRDFDEKNFSGPFFGEKNGGSSVNRKHTIYFLRRRCHHFHRPLSNELSDILVQWDHLLYILIYSYFLSLLQFQSLFYQNHEEYNGSFTRNGKLYELHKAISMHPVKDSDHMYRIYNHFQADKNRKLRQHSINLWRDIYNMDQLLNSSHDAPFVHPGKPLSLHKHKPRDRHDVIDWDFFQRHISSTGNWNPKATLNSALLAGLHRVILQLSLIHI